MPGRELISAYLGLLVLYHAELVVELDKVGEDGVEVGVQLQEDDLPEVRVVDVGQDVEQEAVDLAHRGVERRGELVTWV